ncbi:hypothetical protein [Bradyrhizobium icense]|uniref:Uncharacterized protein n=1 Tax=Bradyrhizobium icense TaxID=1274631 RepID=A0A1B1UDZ1_9BRAD|nr:hypothetical protein [Bradyrhizobium icense]ANW00896.1 hypothetical protein LMTR13_12655 [Bradyrhizobium icense]
MDETGFMRKSLFVLGGLLIWAAHFLFVYVLNALACARNFQELQLLGFGVVPVTIALGTAFAAAAVLALLIIALRVPDRIMDTREPSTDFLRQLAVAVALLSLVAIGWSGLPALLVQPCG